MQAKVWATLAGVLALMQALALPCLAEAGRPAPQTTLGAPEGLPLGEAAPSVQVQLGAHDSEDSASAAYLAVMQKAGARLAPYPPVIVKASTGGRSFFRLRLQGFRDLQEARTLCSDLQLQEIQCIPISAR